MAGQDKPKVLVIDDQWGQPTSKMIPDTYGELSYEFVLESCQTDNGGFSANLALKRVEQEKEGLAVVLLDIMFGDKNDRLGVDILEKLRHRFPVLPILMLTSVEEPRTIIRCMELGANEYIVKRPSKEEMGRILDVYTNPASDQAIYGNSRAIRQLRAQIARITSAPAPSATVLIAGESGTGKELVARAIWRQGRGPSSPFVAKNCAHADSTLLDDELFGHERGAYTGAHEQHIGLLEEANRGVLFLDEIGSMPLDLQGKLLRVLETRQIRRLGGTKDIKTNFQLIAATNKKPRDLLEKGLIGEDFYFRLNQLELIVPPLCEHKEDIPILVELFIKKFVMGGGESYPGRHFSVKAMECLKNNEWRGNIRELRNVVEGAIIMAKNETINLDTLPERITGKVRNKVKSGGFLLPENDGQWARHRVLSELRIIAEALERTEGNATLAVKHLFPQINSPNATYVKRFIKRLQEPPWGYSNSDDEKIRMLIDQINSYSRGSKK